MYAYANVMIERPGVRAAAAGGAHAPGRQDHLAGRREDVLLDVHEDGRAKRIEVETGVSDGEWIEVTNRRAAEFRSRLTGGEPWTPIDGTEQMILGDLSILAEGVAVKVAPADDATKVASRNATGSTGAKPGVRTSRRRLLPSERSAAGAAPPG